MLLESGKLSTTDSNQAKEWYKKAAKNGNAEAQCKIGIYYQDVKKDQNEAIEWFKKSASQDNSEAQYRLGKIYMEKGRLNDGFNLLNKSAKKGNNKSKYYLGFYYSKQSDFYSYDKAKYWFKEYFKIQKNPTEEERYNYALALLPGGYTYEHYGDGTEGRSILEELAENGNVKAQYKLGEEYSNGGIRGGYWDPEKSFYYYKKAADNGYTEAQYMIGEAYINQNRLGGYLATKEETDIDKALSWFRKAANKGHEPSKNMVSQLENLSPVDRLKFLGQNGDMGAITKLGKMYYDGDGVEQDTAQAFYWFKQAADRGNAKAQFNLGVLYRDKSIDSTINANYLEQAFRYFLMSAENGDLNAQYAVGLMYESGEKGIRESGWSVEYVNIVPKDRGKAVYWYKKAAAQGHSKAQAELESLNIY